MAVANSRAPVLGFFGGARSERPRPHFPMYASRNGQYSDANEGPGMKPGEIRAAFRPQIENASRRGFLASSIMLLAPLYIQNSKLAVAAEELPSGFDFYDNSDGFSVALPSSWSPVRGAGSSVFFRNPSDPEENIIVDVSSPSSSRYKGIEDLGTPEEVAQRVLKQYLLEFMSTRIGVQRESKIVSFNSRPAPDGHLLYEVVVSVKSFANNNEMAVMPNERVVKLEWSRLYYSVLGVENGRLYQLRLQTPERALERDAAEFRQIMDSFTLTKLTV